MKLETANMKKETEELMALAGEFMGRAMLSLDADDVDGEDGKTALKVIAGCNRLLKAFFGWSETVEIAAMAAVLDHEKMESIERSLKDINRKLDELLEDKRTGGGV